MAVVNRIYHGAPETRNCLVTASLFKCTPWRSHDWNSLTALFSDVPRLSDAWLDYFLFILFYAISCCCLEHAPQSSTSSGNISRHRAFSSAFWKCCSPPVISALIFDYSEFFGTSSHLQTSKYCSINISSLPWIIRNWIPGMKPRCLSHRLQNLGNQSVLQRITGKKYIGFCCCSPYCRREGESQAQLRQGKE